MANATTLIRNARIVDGSGSPWRFGDVALTGDRIAAVAPPGAIPVDSCAELVDAAGHVVCPGFVDILSHSILSLMVDGRSLSKIAQGVTTEVMGEGWTPAPVGGRISPELPAHQFSQLLDPAWAKRMRRWKRFRDWLEAMIERGRVAQHWLVSGRWYTAKVRYGHGYAPAEGRRIGDNGAGYG